MPAPFYIKSSVLEQNRLKILLRSEIGRKAVIADGKTIAALLTEYNEM